MPATSAFLQGWLEPIVGKWLYVDSPLWTVVGFLGAAIFGSRFILQWLQTEKEKKLVVPWHFWHLSFWGSLLNLLYFMHLDKAPLILGNCFLPFLYGRNILFLRQGGEKGRGRRVFAAVAVLVLVGFVGSVFYPATNILVSSSGHRAMRMESQARNDMTNALQSVQEFVGEYNVLPAGSTRAIFRQLNGGNPRKIQFLKVDPNDITGLGDWLDPWRRPYVIYTSEDSVLIRSAGKDGSLDYGGRDGDDIFLQEEYHIR